MSRYPNNLLLIASVEAESAVRDLDPALPLSERARAAMDAVRGHWLCTDEKEQFVAACEGLARVVGEDERERIIEDLRAMSKVGAMLGALQAGVPVDVEALAEDMAEARERVEPLGLRKIWAESAR